MAIRYVALGPLLSEEGSRAFLGLRLLDGAASPCALVWVPEHVLGEPEQIEQLRKETARAAALQHPNIVQVYGLVELDEGLARAVEFADGESLRRLLKVATRLPNGLAARVVIDAALGVQYAHLSGNEDGTPLVHGDVRPETLLVSYSGVTKVSGYGALTVAPKELGGRRVIGRRRHCAPEQILGGRGAVSQQTDVYLLGALLFELLTGEVPFQGEKDFDKAVVTKQPPLLDSPLVPKGLRPVIGKAMAKKGSLRFPTVQAFCAAVEEATGGIAERAEVADFLERSFKDDDSRLTRRMAIEHGIQEWSDDSALAKPAQAPPPESARPLVAEGSAHPVVGNLAPQASGDAAPPGAGRSARPVAETPARPIAESAAPSIGATAWSLEPTQDSDAESEFATAARRKGTSRWVLAISLAVAAAAAVLWFGRQRPHAKPVQPAKSAQLAPSPRSTTDSEPPVAIAQPSPSNGPSAGASPSPRTRGPLEERPSTDRFGSRPRHRTAASGSRDRRARNAPTR